LTTTWAPWAAKRRASAAPMPPAAPVTTTFAPCTASTMVSLTRLVVGRAAPRRAPRGRPAGRGAVAAGTGRARLTGRYVRRKGPCGRMRCGAFPAAPPTASVRVHDTRSDHGGRPMRLSRRTLLATTTAAMAVSAAPAQAAAAPPAAAPGRGRRPATGFERLAADGYALLDGQRVGVVTNPTGITRDARHIVDVMHADDRVRLTAVFGPEHGFRGTAQAGGSEGRHDDPATGLPVYDTYLKSGQPLADIFTASGVDTVVFDIQDVGARFYTYIWTLYDCMEAARLAGKRFVVLDRPNPVTGRAALGPVLHKEFATFVGREPVSQAHGMTVAELALLFNAEFLTAPVPLETVRMKGWKRSDFYDATGLPWVPPSPNMPTPETALVYSGTCLFE